MYRPAIVVLRLIQDYLFDNHQDLSLCQCGVDLYFAVGWSHFLRVLIFVRMFSGRLQPLDDHIR